MRYYKLFCIVSLRISTRILLFFLLPIFLTPLYSSAQYVGNHDVDSLLEVWNDYQQEDSSRLHAMHQICWNSLMNINNDSLFNLGAIIYAFADSLGEEEMMVDGLWFQGVSNGRQGDNENAMKYFNESLNLSKKIGFMHGMARGYGGIGLALTLSFRYKEALVSMNKGLEISESIDYKDEMAEIYNYKGHLYKSQGDYKQALENFEKSLALSIEMNSQRRMRYDRTNISKIKARTGDFNQALDLLLEIKNELDKGDQRMDKASNYRNIGTVYKEMGKYKLALEYFARSRSLWQELEIKMAATNTYFEEASVHLELGDFYEAFVNYSKGIELYNELGYKPGIILGQFYLGQFYYELQLYEESLENLEEALASFRKLQSKSNIAETLGLMGKVYYAMNDTVNAHQFLFQGLALNNEMGMVYAISNNYIDIALNYKAQNKFNNTLRFLNQSLKIKSQIRDKKGLAINYLELAGLYLDIYDLDTAMIWCEKGFAIAMDLKSLKLKYKAYQCKYSISKHLGDKQKTLQYLERLESLNDSLHTDEVYKQLQQMEFTRQRESDSLAMVEQNLKMELSYRETLIKEKNTRNTFMFSGIGIFIVALGLFGRMRYVRRSNIELSEKNKIIAREKNRAEESEKAKEQFFNNVSHEFRTPLTLILGPLDSAIETTTDTELKPSLEVMQRNAIRLKGMINELLDLSKLEFGKVMLQATEENIVSLTTEYLQSFESLADQQKIKLRFASDVKTCMVWLDVEQYRKILANLLSNAFKFTIRGGEIKVSISTKQEVNSLGADSVSLTISDTGVGIVAEKLPHIFERFYQVGEPSQTFQTGTGIGLALTKELIELHQGSIEAQSEPGKGTVFTLRFLKGNEHLEENQVKSEQEGITQEKEKDLPWAIEKDISGHVSEGEIRKRKEVPELLIVEDNPDMRSYIRSTLENKYTILEAGDGQQGLEKAIEHIPDLVISDVMMPNMDGYEFSETLKADQRTSHIPVILLTARAALDSRIEGLETGADAYVTKPFNARELRVRVKKLIEQRKTLREHYGEHLEVNREEEGVSRLQSTDQKFIEKARSVIMDRLDDVKLDATGFAREMALSRAQLHRKMKAITNKTTTEYIRTVRLNRALILLKNKTDNITQIAYQTGFNSLSWFAKCFKEQFGKTPSEYVNENGI